MKKDIVDYVNTLGAFCGRRDIEDLSQSCIQEKYGFTQADIMVLFGGTILCGGDVLARAIKNKVAKKYIIVGGAGHTTDTLRSIIHSECNDIDTEGRTEAEILNAYILKKYGVESDYLETRSTNCGNNITYLLDLVHENDLPFDSIILCQDATMQLRMAAGLRKYVSLNVCIINYASYQAEMTMQNEELVFTTAIHGMWNPDRYIELLMGEIPRLTDSPEGYGPRGKNYIAHVDIPANVAEAFLTLKNCYGASVRKANPKFASNKF